MKVICTILDMWIRDVHNWGRWQQPTLMNQTVKSITSHWHLDSVVSTDAKIAFTILIFFVIVNVWALTLVLANDRCIAAFIIKVRYLLQARWLLLRLLQFTLLNLLDIDGANRLYQRHDILFDLVTLSNRTLSTKVIDPIHVRYFTWFKHLQVQWRKIWDLALVSMNRYGACYSWYKLYHCISYGFGTVLEFNLIQFFQIAGFKGPTVGNCDFFKSLRIGLGVSCNFLLLVNCLLVHLWLLKQQFVIFILYLLCLLLDVYLFAGSLLNVSGLVPIRSCNIILRMKLLNINALLSIVFISIKGYFEILRYPLVSHLSIDILGILRCIAS